MINIDLSPEAVAMAGRDETLSDLKDLIAASMARHGALQLQDLVFCLEFFTLNYLQGSPTGLSSGAAGQVELQEQQVKQVADLALQALQQGDAPAVEQHLQVCVDLLVQLERQNEHLARVLVDREHHPVVPVSLN